MQWGIATREFVSINDIVHEIKAADLLSILALHTGQLIFIFAEQSSQRQTCPHGKQIT